MRNLVKYNKLRPTHAITHAKMTSDKLFEDQKIQYLNCFQIV